MFCVIAWIIGAVFTGVSYAQNELSKIQSSETNSKTKNHETERSVRLLASSGSGIDVEKKEQVSPYGAALGLRGGYRFLKVPIYIGAEFRDFFGFKRDNVSYSQFRLGVEVGYEITIASNLLLQHVVAIGPNFVLTEEGITSTIKTRVYLAPGFALLLQLNELWILGSELRYVGVIKSSDAVEMYFCLGVLL